MQGVIIKKKVRILLVLENTRVTAEIFFKAKKSANPCHFGMNFTVLNSD
jgi:hypothetical protein